MEVKTINGSRHEFKLCWCNWWSRCINLNLMAYIKPLTTLNEQKIKVWSSSLQHDLRSLSSDFTYSLLLKFETKGLGWIRAKSSLWIPIFLKGMHGNLAKKGAQNELLRLDKWVKMTCFNVEDEGGVMCHARCSWQVPPLVHEAHACTSKEKWGAFLRLRRIEQGTLDHTTNTHKHTPAKMSFHSVVVCP